MSTFLTKFKSVLLIVAVFMMAGVFQAWTPPESPKKTNSNAAFVALQTIGSWNRLSSSERNTLASGGTVNGFDLGLCDAMGDPITANITSSGLPSGSPNARPPRRWGHSSFYLARESGGSSGVQYCFEFNNPVDGFSMDSRYHAYFAMGESITVTAENAGTPVNLSGGFGGNPFYPAQSMSGNGTPAITFNANSTEGGGLWWEVSSNGSTVTEVCIQYNGGSASVEPFRMYAEGSKCVADDGTFCGGSSLVSRWNRLNSSDRNKLALEKPVYGFSTGHCDESGDQIKFLEITQKEAPSSGSNMKNAKSPKTFGLFSLDNGRSFAGGGGNTYCFTLEEATPVFLSSAEQSYFQGGEVITVSAYLGIEPVSLQGTIYGPNTGPVFGGPFGITLNGGGGVGSWWEATSLDQPVSQVCVEYYVAGGAALSREPFALGICASRCMYDDPYACTLSGGSCNGYPKVDITKTVTPINGYGLDQCPMIGNGLPAFEIKIEMANHGGTVKELFLEEDLMAYLGSAYDYYLTPPVITFSSATGPPVINPNYNGITDTDLFIAGTGALGNSQEIHVSFTIELDPNAGASSGLYNSVFGGGAAGSGGIYNDQSGSLAGGYGDPTFFLNLPAGFVATVAEDQTLEATIPNFMNGIDGWLNNNGGAVFTVPTCGPANWSNDYDPANWVQGCGQITGSIEVTFTATTCGYTFETCATFSLKDTKGPTCTKPADLVLDCSDPDALQILQEWLDYTNGNYTDLSTPITFTNDFPGLSGSACNGDPVLVTWTATDACGNESYFDATLTVVDNTAPAFANVPSDLTLDICDDIPDPANVTVTDGCDADPDLVFDETQTGDSCNFVITRTWTATDDCGNSGNYVQTITVSDNDAPVLSNAPDDLNLTRCDDIPTPANVTASDGCNGDPVVVLDETQTGDVCHAIITRTWTATDDCGNTTTHVQTININDDDAPVFSNVPDDVMAECPDVPPVQDPSVSDCSSVTVVFDETQIGGACPLPSQIIRTWIATDECGNADTVTQIVTMTSPTNTGVISFDPPNPTDITANCSDNPDFDDVQTTTTCPDGGLSVSIEDVVNSNGDCSQPFSVTRTWIAHDACGNMVSVSQTINIGPDTEVPTFDANTPTDLTVDCGDAPVQPVAFDNCGPTALTYDDVNVSGDCATGFMFTRNWTATDLCGNTSMFSQNITTSPDNEPPVFTFVPYDQFFDCDDDVIFDDPIVFDNCSDVILTWQDSIIGTGDCNEVNGQIYGYDIIRTWIATDACGNVTTAITNAWILPGYDDGNLIAFSHVPADRTIGCGEMPEFGQAVCRSACGEVTLTFEDFYIKDCDLGTTITRIWTGVDDCGNTVSATQIIEVEPDNDAPAFTYIPADGMLDCSSGVPAFGDPLVADNCSSGTDVALSFEDVWENGGDCNSFTVTRIWTAADPCGNESSASQTLTLMDTEAPVFSATPFDKTIGCSEPIVFDPLSADDVCSNVELTFSDVSTNLCTGSYAVTRTWNAMDACGNESVVSQTITVEDTEAPVFDFVPADKVASCGDAMDFGQVEVSDGCSFANVVFEDETNFVCEGTFEMTRTWTATDGCGNTSQALQKITVSDTDAPVFDFLPADQTLTCDDAIDFGQAVVSDVCSAATLAFEDETVIVCEGTFEMTRTWTATDACGNISQKIQKITVQDATAPVFETTVSDEFINCGEMPVFPDVTAVDGCSNVDITFADEEEVLACETIVTRTWIASDACGNSSQLSQSIHIQDNDAPVLEPLPTNIEMTQVEFAVWTPPAANATDCSAITIDVNNSSESNCDFTVHIFNYLAVDVCGNSADHTLEVLITDVAFAMSMDAPTQMDCGESYDISLNPTNGTAPFAYTWEIISGDDWEINAMPGEPMASVLAGTGDAVLEATITDAFGCEVSQQITLTCEGAVDAVTFEEISAFELKPNPVSDAFMVSFDADISGDAIFKTVDALGRVMDVRSATIKNGSNQFGFDVADLPAGTYLLFLQMEGKTAVERFVKIQ